MNNLADDFDYYSNELELNISDIQKQKLISYVDMLVKWNKAYNLTSVRDPNDMLIKHIFDSLSVSPYLRKGTYADVGTGPGLPGIPLAIMFPNYQFFLIDSLGKRIRFIKQVVHSLDIYNVTTIQQRVENITDLSVDFVLSRAFASIKDMLEWCQHLANDSGQFLALKGNISKDELDEIPIGFKVVKTQQLHVPNLVGKRHLLVINQSKH